MTAQSTQSTQSTRDERCAACEHSPELHDDDCRGLDMFDVKCACSTYVAFEESSDTEMHLLEDLSIRVD